MPRKDDNQSIITQNTSTQNQTTNDMEIEDLNEERNVNKIEEKIPDLTGIEETIIEDKRNGEIYNPKEFWQCFIPKNDLAKKLTSITLKFVLARKKYCDRNLTTCSASEIYIINKEWYNKWKVYSKYKTIKRIIKTYETYKNRPIEFTPEEGGSPGEINNKVLLIRNKVNSDERNILVSKYNDCLDTKLKYSRIKNANKDFKFLTIERFELLKNYFSCDYILKGNRRGEKDNQYYDLFSAHFRFIFVPTLALFKSTNEENLENFKKNQNIIYDVYFKQSAKYKDIICELMNIFEEKPQILTNMGIELNIGNDNNQLSKILRKMKFYFPSSNNQKTAKEMADFIFSNETIEKIKKDKKITQEELELTPDYNFDIPSKFHLNLHNIKENLDEVEKGIIIVEYIELEDQEAEHLASIFQNTRNVHFIETREEYNLDKFPLNKEDNRHGLVGLNNLGNTCYMNTGIQCLSNCELLTAYFIGDYYKEFINKDNPIGSKGEIVERYSQLIHHLWEGSNECISPIQFKTAFGKMYNAFNGYRQQDTQEFISYLLDSLHEDLNKVQKKSYIESKELGPGLSEEEQFKIQKDFYLCRNQSFIVDLIYGFYKSTIFCPNEDCKNIIKTFEPYNMITLSLVNEAQLRKIEEIQNEQNKKLGIKIIKITFIPFKINKRPLKFPVRIKKDMDIFTFKQKIEKITGFNKNSFEIYKNQGGEFRPVKPNIYLLEEFLKGETNVYLFQIPPYVFDKPLDYFDNAYDNLMNNSDKLFLEEEKYEGNNLYKEYNRKEKKNKTDEDLESNNQRKDEMEVEEKEKDKKIKDDNSIINRIQEDEPLNVNNNNNIDEQDFEINDDPLNIDRTQWVKAEFYNYSYSNEKNKNKEKRIDNPRIIYINKNWDNSKIYLCILEMLEGAKNDLEEIKAAWFSDIKDVIKSLGKKVKKKKFNIYDCLEETPNHPLFLQYLRYFNFDKTNIIDKKEGWKNLIFPFDSENNLLNRIIEKAIKDNNDIQDIELLFKIIWKQSFSNEYKEGVIPIELTKSEKLEEVFKIQKEDEFLTKNSLDDKKDKKGKKNKKLKLEELLNNFKEIEKLTKDNQWFCTKCNQFQLADKKMEIYSANEVFIIHLKRFRNNRKIENYVEFPIEGLDLSDFLPKTEEKYIYDLFAVANHIGGLHGGHYFAYCKNYRDGEWYEFNDSNVSIIEKKKVVSNNAYVLFYKKRRETKINEEELFKKPFIEIDYSKYK